MSDKKTNEKLREVIKKSPLTYEKLARKVNVSTATINNAINEGKLPHENTRKAIAKALNSSVDELFSTNKGD